jgi:hypothetical protein
MSRSARPASFRPKIDLPGETTRVLVEQIGAVDAKLTTGQAHAALAAALLPCGVP